MNNNVLFVLVAAAGVGAAIYFGSRPKGLPFGATAPADGPTLVKPEPKPSAGLPAGTSEITIGQVVDTGTKLYNTFQSLFGSLK